MLGETEAQTQAVSPSRVNTSSPAAQLSAPPWGPQGGKGWDGAPGGHCKLWPFGAVWDGGYWVPWESAQALAPLSVGVSASGVVPQGQRRGNAPFQQHSALRTNAFDQPMCPTAQGGPCKERGMGTHRSCPHR